MMRWLYRLLERSALARARLWAEDAKLPNLDDATREWCEEKARQAYADAAAYGSLSQR